MVAQLRKTTKKPVTHVFNTHVHGDHWLGNQAVLEAWPQATIIAHPDMIKQAKDGAAEFWLKLMSDMSGGYTDGTRAEIPTVEAADGQEFRIGGKTFRDGARLRRGAGMRLVDGDTGVLGDEGLVDVDEQLAADVIGCV